jgi:photosystem II stability/assembly factor-like uncharacterized protein
MPPSASGSRARRDASRVYVVAPNYPCLYMSTDGGPSMSAVTTLPTAVTSAWQVAVSQSGATLYVTSGMRVFYSADRAQTWQERTAVGTYTAARVLKLSIDPTDPNTLYASASSAIYSLAVDPTSAQVVYSSTDSALLKSLDGGATWNPLPWDASAAGGYPIVVGIDPKHPSILYPSGVATIARSVDGGTSRQFN